MYKRLKHEVINFTDDGTVFAVVDSRIRIFVATSTLLLSLGESVNRALVSTRLHLPALCSVSRVKRGL